MELEDYLKIWISGWEKNYPEMKEWKKQQLQNFYSYPQKVVVGISDSEGNWVNVGMMDPDEPLKLEMQSEFPPETIKPKKIVLDKFLGDATQEWLDEIPSLQSFLYQHQKVVQETWNHSPTSVAEYEKAIQDALWKTGHYYQTVPVWDEMKNQMPELQEDVGCPGGFGTCWWTSSVWNMVQHLNDSHKWSREKIADWLEESGNNPEFPVPDDVPKEPGEQ